MYFSKTCNRCGTEGLMDDGVCANCKAESISAADSDAASNPYAYLDTVTPNYVYPDAWAGSYAYPGTQAPQYAYPGYCHSCRAQMNTGDSFCMNCGVSAAPYTPYTHYAHYAPYAYYPPYSMPPYGPKPLSRGRAFWRGILPVLLFVALQLVASIVVLLISVFAELTVAFSDGLDAILYTLDNIDYTSTVLNGLLVSTVLSIILFSIMYFKQKKGFTIKQSGSIATFPITILLSIAGSFMLITVLTVIQDFLGTYLQTSGLEFEELGFWQALLTMALVVVLVPIAEELCFRGLSQNQFYKRFSFWAANCLQAGFFGLVHGIPIQVVYAFLIGLLIGWMYFKSGRLGIAIAAHMAFNSGGYLLEFIPNIDKVFESIGLQMLYIFTPSLIVFLATLLLFAITTRKTGAESIPTSTQQSLNSK